MNYEYMNKETLIKILREKDDMLKRLYLEKEKLNYYASVDTMTGVLNRRLGLELLGKEFNLSKINDKNLVVCFLDVDRLKIINDTFGHEEGDKLLFSSLLSLFSDGRPMILYTAEGGNCDTCLKMFLKYGYGQRPDMDQLAEMRTCMDNYDCNMKEVVPKIEKLMEILFPEGLYRFKHCVGIMAD